MKAVTDKGEEGGFCQLLNDIKGGRKPIDAVFEDELFRIKFPLIISAHARRYEDRDELANEVRLRIWRSWETFTPNHDLEYGGFFAWVRKITRNRFLDILPEKVEFTDERPEDQPLVDYSIDIHRWLLYEERVAILERCIAELGDEKERLACTSYVLNGLSSRETAEVLRKAGYACSHVTVLSLVKKALKPYFPQAEGFSIEEIEKKAKAQAGKKGLSFRDSEKKAAEP